MPIYEYQCPGCSYRFGRRRPFSESGEAIMCPRCDTPATRLFSPVATLSKGSDGQTHPAGGNPCSSCSSGTCSTCGL